MTIKKFLKNWLIHLVAIWALLNCWYSILYLYRVQLWGVFSINPDGSPVTAGQMLVTHNLHRPDYLYLVPFILLVELNYWLVFKRYHLVFFITGAIAAASVATFLTVFINFDGARNQFPHNYLEPGTAFAAYAIGYALLREFLYQRMYNVKVRLKRSESELHLLKQQLNPHFLFNTMNYLYGTALQENASRTAEGIDMVADMMRYTVTGMQETFVPLDSEIGFVKNYLHLQQLRLTAGTKQRIETDIKTDEPFCRIAPMLLIPFIENAFKHGLSTEQDSFVRVVIHVENGKLHMQVNNSIIPGRAETKGTNSGLQLAGKRLLLLYPGKHNLQTATTTGTYGVKLELQLN